MINERIEIWKKEEYHPAMIIAPGGAYREVSPSEAHLPAMEFYGAGYNVFVLEYTINQLDEAALKMQPLHDISRAIRMIRSRAEEFHIRPDRIAVCRCGDSVLSGHHFRKICTQRFICRTVWKRAVRAGTGLYVAGKSCDKRYTAMFPVADRNRSDSSGGEQLSLCTGLCTGWCTICTACIFRRNPWTICGNRRVVRAEYRAGRRKKIYTGTGADACRGNRGRRDSISKGKRRGTSGEVRYRT